MFDKICAKCGTKLSRYLRTGYLGCPYCYDEFGDAIESVIKEVQGSVENRGKRPTTDSVDRELMSEYERLVSERETAGLDGRFSDMATLSKEINELFRELKNRGLL